MGHSKKPFEVHNELYSKTQMALKQTTQTTQTSADKKVIINDEELTMAQLGYAVIKVAFFCLVVGIIIGVIATSFLRMTL